MSRYYQKFHSVFVHIFDRSGGIRFRDIRKSRLIYTLAYTFELLLFSFRGHYFSIDTDILGVSGFTVAIAVHGLASLGIMLLWSDCFRPLIRISVAVMILGFVPFFFLPGGKLQFFFALIAYAGLGGAVTSARCGYAFAANNAERIFGILLMFFGTSVIRCFDLPETAPRWILVCIGLVLLFALSACLLCFKEEDFEVKESADKKETAGLYWALIYFIAYFIIDGYIWSILNYSGRTEDLTLFIGLILAGILLFSMLILLKLNVWLVWNLFFIFTAVTALLSGFYPGMAGTKALNFFSGLTVVGWPLCIYMLACAQRYFASYRLLKKCTVIFVLLSPVANFTDELILNYRPQALPIAVMLVFLGVILSLLLLAPYSYKYLFSALWIKDLHQSDMQSFNEIPSRSDPFAEFDLTPRQKEVARLLLEAKTRRQIAGELGLSESTVKTHTSDLYRKIGINSRAELFQRFGVVRQENAPSDE